MTTAIDSTSALRAALILLASACAVGMACGGAPMSDSEETSSEALTPDTTRAAGCTATQTGSFVDVQCTSIGDGSYTLYLVQPNDDHTVAAIAKFNDIPVYFGDVAFTPDASGIYPTTAAICTGVENVNVDSGTIDQCTDVPIVCVALSESDACENACGGSVPNGCGGTYTCPALSGAACCDHQGGRWLQTPRPGRCIFE